MAVPSLASAVFFPGQTLDPGCNPLDSDCTVDTARVGNASPFRFFDLDNTNSVGIQSPVNVAADYLLVLPPDDGDSGQFLTTDGNGILSWGTGSGVLPDPSGHAGKFLQSDGTNAQWASTAMTPYYNGTELQMYNVGDAFYTGFVAPAGLSANSVYTLPPDYPDSNKILQSDSSGVLSWVDRSVSAGALFVGKTTLSYNANLSAGGRVGYLAANYLCDQAFAGSHICTDSEMIYSISQLNISTEPAWAAAAWIATGGAKYSPSEIPANDCDGFTHGTPDTYLGSFWMFDQTDGGAGGLGHCGNTIPLACCR